jgi:hypothetical protein
MDSSPRDNNEEQKQPIRKKIMETHNTAAIGVLVFYFIPAITAAIRQRQPVAIFILNLFLGWTVLGWIIALIWAATNERQVHYIETDD